MEIDIPEEVYAMVEKAANEQNMEMDRAWVCLMLGTVIEMSCPKE